MWICSLPWALFFRSLVRTRRWLAVVCILSCVVTVVYRIRLLDSNTSGQFPFQYDTDYNESLVEIGVQETRNNWRARLPRALIIGVRKGGTRALLDALALHSAIRIARQEVHYFDKTENFERGTDWYLKQMPTSSFEQITIEKTPAYFVSPAVVERVFEFDAKMKLILIVRDPVIRLISDFTQVLHTRMERNKTLARFENAIFTVDARRLNHTCKPVRNSLYAQHLERWLRLFPLRQLHVVDGDLFIKDPLHELRAVERFLGVTPAIRSDQLVYNKRKGFYCFRYKMNRGARCLGATKGRAQVRVDAATRREVARLFRDENEQFFRQIGRRFDHWLWL